MLDTTYHAIEAWRASCRSEPCLRIILGRAAATAILFDGGPCIARDEILEEIGRLEMGGFAPMAATTERPTVTSW